MTKKEIKEKFEKLAQKTDWDELSYDIIIIEKAIRKKQDAKTLNLLMMKLEIWEKEKASRIFSKFNIKTILNRGLDDSYVEFS